MRILIVEDQERLASMIKDILTHGKYFVDVVHDGEAGLDYARSDIYDGLIFDVNLPVVDGVTGVKTLRNEGIATPVLFLTSRTEPWKRTAGLETGAEFYLSKPFRKEALLASVKRMLGGFGDSQETNLTLGDLCLHLADGSISCKGETLSLSAREFELARLLMSSQDRLVAKETIFLKIWGYDSQAESNVVEAYVSFLRRKLRQLQSETQLVAVRCKGYHLLVSEPPQP